MVHNKSKQAIFEIVEGRKLNLPKFLKEVDHISGLMSKEEIAGFVHDIARILPEAMRENFLDRLKGMSEKQEICIEKEDTAKDKQVLQEFQSVKEKLESIEKWEMGLVGSLNEEYDDWYCNDSEEFLYEDPEGVLDIIENACSLVHQCIDTANYHEAFELAEILVGLKVMVGGEYQDYSDEPMSIQDFGYYHISDVDYRQLVVDAMYAAYCVSEGSERPDAVYIMLENSGIHDITMEMVMQNGGELPETDEFLKLWIAYLGKITSNRAQKLLQEAVELCNDTEQLLENARDYHVEHPGLYEQYLLNIQGQEDDRKLYEIGREALEAIACKYVVRSRIALMMSEAALRLDREEEAEKCWVEAFRSDTSVANYLRLLMECKEFSSVKEEVKRIYQGMYAQIEKNQYAYNPKGELQENKVGAAEVYMLAFFGGELQYVKEHAMGIGKTLGWSSTFMKCGLAAFLLLLLENEELQPGCREMCRKVVSSVGFEKEDYEHGISRHLSESSQEWFWKCFCHWKHTLSISEEEKLQYLEWVETLVTKRLLGIMEGNYRKYYGECAGYIAALGEVRESRGEIGGKQSVMAEYKVMYSRRSAFHNELRAFGMRDGRRR
ncbi:MAG: hypothetical protein HFH15_07810 [Ruminococcus sp.]|nr:hypothetical protein [Ruminococcus sp.]